MTMIHQCDACGYQGRVVELADGYLCESCFEEQEERQAAEICPECGREVDTGIGLCSSCANSPEIMPQPDC